MPPFNAPDNYDVNLLRGDHVIKFKVEMPAGMSEQEREILREFARMEHNNRHKYYSQKEQAVRDNTGKPAATQETTSNPTSGGGGIFGSIKSIFK